MGESSPLRGAFERLVRRLVTWCKGVPMPLAQEYSGMG